MKPITTVKRNFMPPLNLARIAALVAVGLVAFALAPAGCVGGWDYSNVPEGDRCNPYDSHNECSSGLACTVSSWQLANQGTISAQGNEVLFLGPGAASNSAGAYDVLEFCPENYCCPVDSDGNLTTSTNPNCQPGCNGGAASICTAVGNSTPPYVGVCDFADSGVLPEEAGSDAESSDAESSDAEPTPDAGDATMSVEASTSEASTSEASTSEASTSEASTSEASTSADGSSE
jgi:hypothetical protein